MVAAGADVVVVVAVCSVVVLNGVVVDLVSVTVRVVVLSNPKLLNKQTKTNKKIPLTLMNVQM